MPHTEIGRVTRNGLPVSLDRHGSGATDVIEVQAVPPSPPWPHGEPPRFIADVHLARLARYLRFAGYDTLHRDAWPDAALAATAAQEQRIVLSRDTIYERIWGYDFGPDSKNLPVYIGYLRRKLTGAGAPPLIHTLRGVGYTLRRP